MLGRQLGSHRFGRSGALRPLRVWTLHVLCKMTYVASGSSMSSSTTATNCNPADRQCNNKRGRKKEKEGEEKKGRKEGELRKKGQGGQEGRDGLDSGDKKRETEEENYSDLRQSGRVQGDSDGGKSDRRRT